MKTRVYQALLDEMDDKPSVQELAMRVYDLLDESPEGKTRQELVLRIYGHRPLDLSRDRDDRRIRLVIGMMRERLIPIVSNSGEAGYRLDTSEEAMRSMLDELISRRQAMDERIERARLTMTRNRQGQGLPRPLAEPVQLTF